MKRERRKSVTENCLHIRGRTTKSPHRSVNVKSLEKGLNFSNLLFGFRLRLSCRAAKSSKLQHEKKRTPSRFFVGEPNNVCEELKACCESGPVFITEPVGLFAASIQVFRTPHAHEHREPTNKSTDDGGGKAS